MKQTMQTKVTETATIKKATISQCLEKSKMSCYSDTNLPGADSLINKHQDMPSNLRTYPCNQAKLCLVMGRRGELHKTGASVIV